jgi:anti-sigma factor RsiW
MELSHEEIESLLGAYALDAVDDDERAAVERHLPTCPRCRSEVDAHREVAAHLATGAAAPAEAWDAIAAAIDGGAPPPLRLTVTRRRPRPGLLAVAAAVAVAVALVAGVLIGGRDSGAGRDGNLAAAALDAFESPGARTVALLDGSGTTVARAAVLPDGSGYLLAESLPDLDAGTYQLWGSDGATVVSLGVLGRAPGIAAFHADPGQATLLISEEAAPVAAPAGLVIAHGDLT